MAKKESTKKVHNLDMWEMLRQINARNFNWFDAQSEEAQNEFSAWKTQRFMLGKCRKNVTAITNKLISSLPNDLAYRLFCAISNNKTEFHKWTKPLLGKRDKYNPKIIALLQEHYVIGPKDAKVYYGLLSNAAIKTIALDNGRQKDELKGLKK